MKKESIKAKQKRYNDLFKRIQNDLLANGATFVAIPDPTTGNMRVVMVEQEEATKYFNEVEKQVQKQVEEQMKSFKGKGDKIGRTKKKSK